MESFIYLVKAGNYLKVGISVDVDTRISKFATTSPEQMELLAVIAGERDLERSIHKMFKHLRVRGEWFRDSEELRKYFKVEKYEKLNKEPEVGDYVIVSKGSGIGTIGFYDNDEGDLAVIIVHNRADCPELEINPRKLSTIRFNAPN